MSWRPRRFRTGAMRERIDVQTATESVTSGEVNRTWADTVINEPASFEIVSGGETLRGRQVDANVNAVFTVRHRDSTYSVEQRIQHNGSNYGVVRIVPVEGGNRYIELHCKLDGIATFD